VCDDLGAYPGLMGRDQSVKQRFEALSPFRDERQRRLMVGTEAAAIGYGGISAVSRATGISRDTIRRGLAELNAQADEDPARVRQPGGGRKQAKNEQPGLLEALRELVEPITRGDPESSLRWVSKAVRKLSAALRERGFIAGRSLVGRLLKDELTFNLQANAKVLEGSHHPDRNAQFEHIADRIKAFRADNQPVISVDAKKKALIGDYKNNGREWRPQGEPELVNVHDFAGQLGKANPYGVYDIVANAGWVGVGLSADTAEFAVETIRRWYHTVGKPRYPNMTRLFITADGGGSNGSRLRLWKTQLQKLADEIGVEIAVSHYPPGTSSRVDDWRGGFSLPVGHWWCFRTAPSIRIGLTSFPVAARQTGHADRPHPAFTCVVMPSRSAGQHDGAARHTGRASHRGTRPDIGGTRCLLVRCVSPTNVEDAVVHTNARSCRPVELAPG
jgi:Rhodopirellula transposase DDE domain